MNQRILYCNCSNGEVVADETRREARAALAASGVEFAEVSDLCGVAARCPDWLREMAGAGGLTVIACFPRAVRWLLHFAGAEPRDGRLEVLNMRTMKVGEIMASVLAGRAASAPAAAERRDDREDDWIPWFPVVDYDRCTGCKQCLSFCPFGVYESSPEGEVVVANPANCKNKCPACARICPAGAIIFPKCDDEGTAGADVQGGAEPPSAEALAEKLAAGDLHAILSERRNRLRAVLAQKGCDCDCDCGRSAKRTAEPIEDGEADDQAGPQ